ncbi:MAG: hypothetical protein FWH05_07035 [Oscillospiraceae bacterium]|nr:hypothetical protein [Oscillospiraceae bacterium]
MKFDSGVDGLAPPELTDGETLIAAGIARVGTAKPISYNCLLRNSS